MDFLGIAGSAAAWLAPVTAWAVMSTLAAVILLRDHLRLERHAVGLEGQVERLRHDFAQIEESHERDQALLDAHHDLVVMRDAAGFITVANGGFARFVQRRRSDLTGTRYALRPVVTRPAQALGDGAVLIEEAFERPDGLRWIAWIETAVAAGGPLGTLRVGRDITEQMRARAAIEEAKDKAEAESEAKSRLLATAGHELRTPLGGILGMAELALDTPLSPEQTSYLRAIKTSGEALLTLLDEILDHARIEAGRIELAERAFDIRALVESVVELLAPRAQGKGLEIAGFVSDRMPQELVADPERLRQILLNLAGNAVKFTEQGGVGIAVERLASGDLQIAVSDTGPGIDPAAVAGLFAEFEQGEAAASASHGPPRGAPERRRPGGAGLGLAITSRIVERMAGTIEVKTTPGAGATFLVRLPIRAAEGAGPPPARRLRDRRIVILGQRSPFTAPFLRRQLEEAGAAVSLVATPDDALARVATSSCDVLIVDGALGPDAARDVAHEARRAGIAKCLVLLSPFERRALGSPAEAGFDGSLVKPLPVRALCERLAETPPTRSAEPELSPAIAPSAAAPPIPRKPGRGSPRVLLAEDNEVNALLALKSLEKLGALVDWARDGQEALALAEASLSGSQPAYDLVLMDIRMPGLDGNETTRRIRLLEKTLRREEPTRIIALTARAMKNDREAAQAAGFDGFLPKPYPADALRDLLAEVQQPVAQAS